MSYVLKVGIEEVSIFNNRVKKWTCGRGQRLCYGVVRLSQIGSLLGGALILCRAASNS